MSKQRVLVIRNHNSDDLTSRAHEWTLYDTDMVPLVDIAIEYEKFKENNNAGKYTDDGLFYKYSTVFQALACGWKLLMRDSSGLWWLVRD